MQNNFNYKNIDTWKDRFGGVVNAVVEITKGTVIKNELDCKTGILIPVKILHKKYKYKFNYGFINQTYADDNDPVDIAVVCRERLLPKSVLPCRVVGVIKTVDKDEQDDKIIAVPIYKTGGKSYSKKVNIKRLLRFFSKYKYPNQKGTVVQGAGDEDEALEIIQKAEKAYQAKFSVGGNN